MRKLASLAFFLFAFAAARADQLIVNGGFESGSLSGWVATSTGDGGFFANTGGASPLTYNATVGAHSGTYYAISDDYSGSQTQYLTQTFTTPTSFTSAVLSFSMFVNDVYGQDYGSSGPGGKVTLLNALGAQIAVLYGPMDTFENPVGNPNPYLSYSQNIASYLLPGTSYRLQFSSSDVAGLINTGIDDVSLITTAASPVPEPETLSLVMLGGCFSICIAWQQGLLKRRFLN